MKKAKDQNPEKLKTENRNKKPKGRKYATFDCETDPFKFGRIPEPFIWGFYDEDGFKYFYETNDFIDFIKEYDGIIYAHNGGKFDFYFLFEGLDPQDTIMIINGRIAKMKIGKCELRDSFLLLPVPLATYQKDKIDYALFEKNKRKKHLVEIVEYLKGDVKYLYDILKANFDDYGQKLTLASSAFDFWNKEFNVNKKKPSSGRAFYEHFSEYYYGGRVQCFEKGLIERDFEAYDINSAYPYAMQFEHPCGNAYSVSKKLPKDKDEFNRCFIKFWGVSRGVLPYRDKNTLTFPNDSEPRLYHATGWEMALGLEKNLIDIIKIERVQIFEETISFKNYVDHFFKMKSEYKDKDPARYLLTKLYLNSLYGKFGQSSIKHRNYELIDPQFIEEYLTYEEHDYAFEGELGAHALVSEPIEEKHMRFYNVTTASSITGFVRAYLYSHILECETPIYCDTDSIAFSGKSNFKVGTKLGEWEKEGDFVRGAIGGKKLYAFKYKNQQKYKLSSKGVKLNEKEIFSIAKGNTILYKNIAPTFSIKNEPKFLTRNVKLT